MSVSEPEARTSTTFEQVSTLTPLGPDEFAAEIHPAWTIGGRPNGGYLLSLLGRAAAVVVDHRNVMAASTVFLRSPDPGPVSVTTCVLRQGRSASQVRATMLQAGRPVAEALCTVGDLDPTASAHWTGGLVEPPVRPVDECIALSSVTPDGVPVDLMGQVHIAIDPDTAGFLRGAPAGAGVLNGWLELPGSARFDPSSLLFAVDAFPPATFDVEMAGWVPTLELTVYVRALPVPGPVHVVQRAQVIDGRRVDETCSVWDQAGRLVAQGTQLAAIRLG